MAAVEKMPAHIWGKGDITYVLNQSFSGKPIVEGKAQIIKRLPLDHYYEVRFLNDQDGGIYDRFIHPGDEYQAALIKRAVDAG